MPKSPTNPKGSGRKTKEYKQETYSFRCYPHQIEEIRTTIKKIKENDTKIHTV